MIRQNLNRLSREPVLCMVLMVIFIVLIVCSVFKMVSIAQERKVEEHHVFVNGKFDVPEEITLFLSTNCTQHSTLSFSLQEGSMHVVCDDIERIEVDEQSVLQKFWFYVRVALWSFLLSVFGIMFIFPAIALLVHYKRKHSSIKY